MSNKGLNKLMRKRSNSRSSTGMGKPEVQTISSNLGLATTDVKQQKIWNEFRQGIRQRLGTLA